MKIDRVYKIKTALMKNGISQRQLSIKLDTDDSSLSRLINYGIGTRWLKEKLSEYLGVPVDRLFPDGNKK